MADDLIAGVYARGCRHTLYIKFLLRSDMTLLQKIPFTQETKRLTCYGDAVFALARPGAQQSKVSEE